MNILNFALLSLWTPPDLAILGVDWFGDLNSIGNVTEARLGMWPLILAHLGAAKPETAVFTNFDGQEFWCRLTLSDKVSIRPSEVPDEGMVKEYGVLYEDSTGLTRPGYAKISALDKDVEAALRAFHIAFGFVPHPEVQPHPKIDGSREIQLNEKIRIENCSVQPSGLVEHNDEVYEANGSLL